MAELTPPASGRLIGVGVGPGAPDLMTLRAVAAIASAPVVAYPRSSGRARARDIAAAHIRPDAREIVIELPMSPDRAPGQAAYDIAAGAIAADLAAGRDVAVLCEGDPLFYGSFMYLMARLGGAHPVEVIPGVTSPSAAAAAARVPLGAREGRIAVLPGTLRDAALREGIAGAETAVVMKLGRHFPRLRALIAAMGLMDRSTYVEDATGPAERVLPLAEAPDSAPYFALLIIRREADAWL